MEHQNEEKINRLIEIGTIFASIGITTVELAQSLIEHVQNCSGGKICIENLLNENDQN